jgi:ATP-dependent DNA helicase PIF1
MIDFSEELFDLSDEQELALIKIISGKNVLITGDAGTGKSFLMKRLIELTAPAVTASTGVAALQIGGETIHSWSGIGVGDKPASDVIRNLRSRQSQWGDQTLRRMVEAKTLVVDEISMLSADLLDLLDATLCLARDSHAPFGGIQVVFVGDLLQLPPVSRDGKAQFPFKSQAWQEADIDVVVLTQVFRQEERRFSQILKAIRFDEVTPEVEAFLIERFEAEDPDPARPACILHTHNAKCDVVNARMLRELPGVLAVFKARDEGKHENFVRQIERDCLAPTELCLKPGARVMLLTNLDTRGGLVNGSMGHFLEADAGGDIRVLFDNGREESVGKKQWEFKKGGEILARRTQFPLRLARAVTVHKSQGLSLDKVETDLSKCFSPGQAYVALSRARTAEGLFLRGSGIVIEAHPEAVKFYRQHDKKVDEVVG